MNDEEEQYDHTGWYLPWASKSTPRRHFFLLIAAAVGVGLGIGVVASVWMSGWPTW